MQVLQDSLHPVKESVSADSFVRSVSGIPSFQKDTISSKGTFVNLFHTHEQKS